MVAFWSLAPIMVIAALGILVVRKAVHAALLLATVMICLAVQYAALDAPFLFAVQIVVYTGAILMLFLFVLMLVGVDHADTWTEVIKGQRFLAVVGGLLFGATLIIGVTQLSFATPAGLEAANAGGNVEGLAQLMFSRYIVAFEVTSALLITAAMGAMLLAHRERLTPKLSQADLAAQRMRDYASAGVHPGNLPAPGTYARSNSVDTPALLPDGSVAPSSVPRVIQALVGVAGGLDTPLASSGHSTSGDPVSSGHSTTGDPASSGHSTTGDPVGSGHSTTGDPQTQLSELAEPETAMVEAVAPASDIDDGEEEK